MIPGIVMNKIDTKQQLLVITMEECAELQMVCSKILRQGHFTDKRSSLVEELGDVQCMIQLMIEHGILDYSELNARVKVKRNKLKEWSDLITGE